MLPDGKTEYEYESFLRTGKFGPIFWPWWVAVEYYNRKNHTTVTKEFLMRRGRNGCFKYGRKAKCSHRNRPVDRDSFQRWVQGKSQILDEEPAEIR